MAERPPGENRYLSQTGCRYALGDHPRYRHGRHGRLATNYHVECPCWNYAIDGTYWRALNGRLFFSPKEELCPLCQQLSKINVTYPNCVHQVCHTCFRRRFHHHDHCILCTPPTSPTSPPSPSPL